MIHLRHTSGQTRPRVLEAWGNLGISPCLFYPSFTSQSILDKGVVMRVFLHELAGAIRPPMVPEDADAGSCQKHAQTRSHERSQEHARASEQHKSNRHANRHAISARKLALNSGRRRDDVVVAMGQLLPFHSSLQALFCQHLPTYLTEPHCCNILQKKPSDTRSFGYYGYINSRHGVRGRSRAKPPK